MKNAAFITLGAMIGVVAIVFIDVQVSLAAINPSDPSTWPNMGPQSRYLLVPFLLGIVLLFALLIDPLIRLVVTRAPLYRSAQSISLGLCYSLLLMALPLDGLLPRHPGSLIVGPVLAIASASFLRWFCARWHRVNES